MPNPSPAAPYAALCDDLLEAGRALRTAVLGTEITLRYDLHLGHRELRIVTAERLKAAYQAYGTAELRALRQYREAMAARDRQPILTEEEMKEVCERR